MRTYTYDFNEVNFSFGGQVISGYAEGDAITVTKDEATWSKASGADGEVARSKNNNQSGKFVIRLQQTSLSNDVLMGFLALDRKTNAGTQTAFLTDKSGRSLHAAETAWVVGEPEVGYGREAGTREWTIETGQLTSFVGGSN